MTRANGAKGLASLIRELRAGSPRQLEQLTADLVGRLLKVRVEIAAGGFQHGGDAGTTGRAGRHLRIECKRYAENTPLSDRELQGEVDDAIRRNPELEAWILVSTRRVSENTQEALNLKAREVGVPILVIDWSTSKGTIPDLAALCGWAPDLVDARYGKPAGKSAMLLTPLSHSTVERLRAELAPWKIGYKQLKRAAEVRIRRIWGSEIESRAAFAQNAAGGAAAHLVRRGAVHQALSDWWKPGGAQPVVAYGGEGVGKTWAILQWIVLQLRRLPITLVLPSSAFRDIKAHTEAGVLEFLAGLLHDIVGSQDRGFWQERLRRLFQGPRGRAPVILILIDGVNQEPSFEWIHLVQILQGGCFRGRVCLILSTQTHYLEERLHGMRAVSGGVRRIGVEPYDLAPGGELEQLLSAYGKTLESTPRDLVPLLRIPRLFPIAVKFSSDAAMQGDATPSRLLWAHGRDELSLREQRAFSEQEWEDWLLQLARSYWDAIESGATPTSRAPTYTLADLDEMVARRTLEPSHNYRRLQEIVDGTWMEQVPGRPGVFRPKADTIHLALGAAVLRFLEDSERAGSETVDGTLARWLDPVAATSVAPDILAAAMSIAVAKGVPQTSSIPAAIVTALLQSQNAQDSHRQQVVALAPTVFGALLDALERSSSRTQASARHWASVAVRGISTANLPAWDEIRRRLVTWIARVPCPSPSALSRGDDYARHQADRLRKRIGVDSPGVHRVMGVPVRLEERVQDDLADSVPGMLLGTPLGKAMPVFAAAAVVAAINMNGRSPWEGLKWLIELNPTDSAETLRRLADMSKAALAVPTESGVHPEMPRRVAALLLWLTGSEDNEQLANTLRVSFEGGLNYEQDYLSQPTRSFFIGLERRHLDLLWDDREVALLRRIQMAKPYLSDPAVRASDRFIQELEREADLLDISKLDTNLSVTSEDHTFADFKPGVARFAPAALRRLVARWFAGLPARASEARHWAGVRAPRYLLLSDPAAASAARALRSASPHPPGRDEEFLATQLLMIELVEASLDEQLDALVGAANAHLTLDLLGLLRSPQPRTIERLLKRWGPSSRRAVEVALNYVAEHDAPLDAEEFSLLAPYALPGSDAQLRVLAFIGLERSNSSRFGKFLLDARWKVEPSQTVFEQDHGSRAVLSASQLTPLEDMKYTVAPWCLLAEARRRGGRLPDVKLAAQALSAAVNVDSVDAEHPGVDISVDVVRRPGLLSFDPPNRTTADGGDWLRDQFNPDAQVRRQEEARESGHEFLSRARDAGAVMAVKTVEVLDARMLVEACSTEVDLWIDGYEERTPAFRGRVNLAGGLYVALCEALLELDWRRGVDLWRAVSSLLQTKFVGRGGVSELTHMLFRVPDNTGVLVLRREAYSLARSPNDKSYVDIVLAALTNGRRDWLQARVDEDAASGVGWRRKRAIMLTGLLAERSPDAPAWHSGPAVGTWGSLRRRGDTWVNRQAFARHWWCVFLATASAEAAYSAWQMFLLSVDRRALIWLKPETDLRRLDDELWRRKMAQVEVNWSQVEAAMRDAESKGTNGMDRTLFGWNSPETWFEPSQLERLEA